MPSPTGGRPLRRAMLRGWRYFALALAGETTRAFAARFSARKRSGGTAIAANETPHRRNVFPPGWLLEGECVEEAA